MIAGIEVSAAHATLDALDVAGERHAHAFSDYGVGDAWRYNIQEFESFQVLPFPVDHDVACTGFVVREKATDEYLLFAIDFFALEQRFSYPFSIVALSCSFDKDILQRLVDDKAIDEGLAKRLLFSHPSKQWLMDYLRDHVNLSKCRQIHLLHCSAGNLDKEAARKEIEDEFMIEVL